MRRNNHLRLAAVIGATAVVGVLAAGPAAQASVTPVLGSAFGYQAKISFFGGPPKSKGPTPTVKLPKGGSVTPVKNSAASGSVVFGPATLLTTGAISLKTHGTNGFATSSASLSTVDAGPFTASSVSSSCTASNAAPTGSVTINGGVLVTSTDANGNPTSTVDIPANPTVNDTVHGTLQANGTTQDFTWIFNEHITNTNGSLTVNAAHEELMGPTAVGDLVIGDARCRA